MTVMWNDRTKYILLFYSPPRQKTKVQIHHRNTNNIAKSLKRNIKDCTKSGMKVQ